MKAIEIRNKYLNFFKKHGHSVIPSAPLIPENDPSVLFTTAGMQPLVPYLLGQKHPSGTRLTDFQKCVWNIYHDSENYAVVNPVLMLRSQKINYDSTMAVNRWQSRVGSFTYANAITGLLTKNVDAQAYFEGLATVYSSSE